MIDEVKLIQAAEMLEEVVRLVEESKPKDEMNVGVYRVAGSARAAKNAVRQLIEDERVNEQEQKRRNVFHRRCQTAIEAIEAAMRAMRTARVMSYQCIQLSVGMGYDKDYRQICEFDEWADDIELSCPDDGILFDHDMFARIANEDKKEQQ